MPTVAHSSLQQYLGEAKAAGFAPVYLVHGQELLCKRALEGLLTALLPGGGRDLNYEPLEGTDARVPEAIEKVNTFSLLAGTKVVSLLEATVFHARVETTEFLQKAADAHQRGDFKRAAAHLLNLLSLRDLSLEDLDADLRAKTLGAAAPQSGEDRWLDEVLAYCGENALKVPPRTDAAKLLQAAVERGFPKGNHLIVTTERVDRRHGLYRALESRGVVIDCTVPGGEGQADRRAQEAVLTAHARSLLSETGKKLEPAAFRAMIDLTGFDLRSFGANLEKLASYVGSRPSIGPDDVAQVLERTRVDPLYEFTNAVTERNLPAALFTLDTLLAGGAVDHPLQLLAAMVNQARRLLVFRDFLESPQGSVWQPGCTYAQFQSRVMPAVREFDRLLAERIDAWHGELQETPDAEAGATKTKGGKKAGGGGDLAMAAAGRSPYPVYLTLQKAGRFSRQRIVEIMAHLQQADRRLKSSAGDPKLVLEEAVMRFCR